jgi:hypothetical protein
MMILKYLKFRFRVCYSPQKKTHTSVYALVARGKQPVASTQPGLAQMVALTQLRFWVAACISRTGLFFSNGGG